MLTEQENERLTRVGRGTPMGELQRRYWLPVVLSRELPEPDCPPVRIRLLGEDLIGFRDTAGAVGLVDAFCPHRRAPMFFGRNEECGLRCVYHGWKFDVNGNCVDMPSEPPDSLFKQKVTITAYPTFEGAGMVWAFLGAPERQPPIPDFEFLRAPETHVHATRTVEACNWLQALEGGIDTSHTSSLHADIRKRKEQQQLKQLDRAPKIDVEKTEYGYRYAGLRFVPGRVYGRVYHYVLPAVQLRGSVTAWETGGGLRDVPTLRGHFWVPMDDVTTNVFNFMYSYDPEIPLSQQFREEVDIQSGHSADGFIPGTFRPRQNASNDYCIDRRVQKYETFTGIKGVNMQDFAMQEGMGPIVDRTREHLGMSDRAIIAARQVLLDALQVAESGGTPGGVDPASYRNIRAVDLEIPEGIPWQVSLHDQLVARF